MTRDDRYLTFCILSIYGSHKLFDSTHSLRNPGIYVFGDISLCSDDHTDRPRLDRSAQLLHDKYKSVPVQVGSMHRRVVRRNRRCTTHLVSGDMFSELIANVKCTITSSCVLTSPHDHQEFGSNPHAMADQTMRMSYKTDTVVIFI